MPASQDIADESSRASDPLLIEGTRDEAPPSRHMSMRSVVDACTFVDELLGDAVGELSIGSENGEVEGALFVERGRVCWGAARGLSRRLSALLASVAGLSSAEMEAHYTTCKKARVPLGEYLVLGDIIDAASLRRAILQHTTESIVSLCSPNAKGGWIPRLNSGYSPRFTFSTAEILTSARAQSRLRTAERLTIELRRTFNEKEWGAAFVREAKSGVPEPVALIGAHPDLATALLRAGKWAASTLDVAGVICGPDSFVMAEVAGRAFLAYMHGDAIIVGVTSSYGPARILNRRSQERLTKAGGDGRL